MLKREFGVQPDDETIALVRRIRMESSTPSATVSDAIDHTVTHAVRLPPVIDKPSIAVLPFQNMSGDPEQEYFVDGMVEEIITALSRIRWLLVIARNSSFTYKGQAVDVRQVGRELAVRYVLEGSVRKVENLVRISAQLIDAGSGGHLSADRFDGSLEEIFELQDRVASSVAGIIEPALQAAEAARSAGRPTADLTAYDLYLRAHAMIWSSARQILEALPLLEQAIAHDPRYGLALAWAAYCCFRLVLDGRSDEPTAHRLKSIDFARRALEVAGDDPGILANAAQALAYFGEDIGAMMALVDRALALNPNFARGWHVSGVLRMEAGQPDIAIAHVETSLRLSPRARVGTAIAIIGEAHFLADDSMRQRRIYSSRSRRIPASRTLSLSCRLLRAYGTPRRGARDHRTAAFDQPCRDPGRKLSAQRQAPQAVSVRPAPGGCRKSDSSHPRRSACWPAGFDIAITHSFRCRSPSASNATTTGDGRPILIQSEQGQV